MMPVDALRDRLRKFSESQIHCRDHAVMRLERRMISHQDVIEHLTNPVKLYKAVKGDSIYAHEEKFKLYFNESKKYDLVVVMVFQNNHIEVITTYLRNKKITPEILNPK